jgi:3-hydroxybenzoate 6-monooxygenase
VAHRSDVHRIVLDACRRAGVELLMAALSSGWVPGRTYCAGGEVDESQAGLAVDGLPRRCDRPVVDNKLICAGMSPTAGDHSDDVLTKVDLTDVVAGSDPVAISSGMGWAVGRSSTRSRCSVVQRSHAVTRSGAGPTSSTTPSRAVASTSRRRCRRLWCDR